MVAITAWLWKITPGSLVPDEDQGFYIGAVILPDGASLERTDKVVKQVEEAIRANPANQDIVSFTGFDFIGGGFRNNAATLFVMQVPWDKREVTAASLVGELFGRTMGIKEALVLAFNPPAIFGLGTTGGFEFYIQNRGEGGAKRLAEVTQAFLARANSDKELGGAQTLWRATVPQLYVDIDREKAKKLGVPIDDVYNALAGTLGTYYVNDFNKYGRTWQVLMSADPAYRKRPDDIGGVYVRSAKGEMIPLSSLATVKYSSGPDALDRFNNLPAVKIIGQAAPGFSSGQAIARVEQIAAEVLPPDFSFDWGGTSYQEKRSGGASDVRARAGGDHGVPDPVRAVRAVVAAALGAARAAVRHVRRARRRLAARPDQRRLLPDRPRHAARPRGEERDPDRRVRAAASTRRACRRRRRRSRRRACASGRS